MTVHPWQLRAAAAAGTALVVALTFALSYLPGRREIHALETEVEALQRQRAQLQVKLRDREGIQAARARSRAALDAVEARVPRSKEAAVAELREAAAAAGANVAEIKVGDLQLFGGFVTRDFTVDVSAPFLALHAFLGRIEAIGEHVAIRSLQIARGDARSISLSGKVVVSGLHVAGAGDLPQGRAPRRKAQ